MRSEFKKLKSKCQTKAQKLAFNKLVKSFAKIGPDHMDTWDDLYIHRDSSDDAKKVLQDYLGNDIYACHVDEDFSIQCDSKLMSAFNKKDLKEVDDYQINLSKFENNPIAFVLIKDSDDYGNRPIVVLGKKGVQKLSKYLDFSYDSGDEAIPDDY